MSGDVTIELKPRGTDFVRAVARLKGESPQIRKKLTAGVRDATKESESKLKEAVMGIQSAGHAGGGGRQRDEFHKGRLYAAQRKRVDTSITGAKLRDYSYGKARNTGLRAGIARGITRKITTSGFRIGVRVRASADYLPASQKVLVKATNRGKVRHPFFGNREVWVDQTFTPARWFDKTMAIYGPTAVRKIEALSRQIMNDLQG